MVTFFFSVYNTWALTQEEHTSGIRDYFHIYCVCLIKLIKISFGTFLFSIVLKLLDACIQYVEEINTSDLIHVS